MWCVKTATVLMCVAAIAVCLGLPLDEEPSSSGGAAPDRPELHREEAVTDEPHFFGPFSAATIRPIFTPEEPCSRAGGICLLAFECPEGKQAQSGLCPNQAKQGAECCHGLSTLERRCSKRGGMCRPKRQCGRALWEPLATDCPEDEKCCVLVAV